jgi:hypothetical protein
MDSSAIPPQPSHNVDLTQLDQQVKAIVNVAQGDSVALLALLRVLESLHREICEGAFHASLPNTRQALYSLLRDIEAEGGWPHIPRLKIQALLGDFFLEEQCIRLEGEGDKAAKSPIVDN